MAGPEALPSIPARPPEPHQVAMPSIPAGDPVVPDVAGRDLVPAAETADAAPRPKRARGKGRAANPDVETR